MLLQEIINKKQDNLYIYIYLYLNENAKDTR